MIRSWATPWRTLTLGAILRVLYLQVLSGHGGEEQGGRLQLRIRDLPASVDGVRGVAEQLEEEVGSGLRVRPQDLGLARSVVVVAGQPPPEAPAGPRVDLLQAVKAPSQGRAEKGHRVLGHHGVSDAR